MIYPKIDLSRLLNASNFTLSSMIHARSLIKQVSLEIFEHLIHSFKKSNYSFRLRRGQINNWKYFQTPNEKSAKTYYLNKVFTFIHELIEI